MTPRRAGTKATSTVRGPRTGPAARATGPTGCRGRMRMGPLASMVTAHRPTRLAVRWAGRTGHAGAPGRHHRRQEADDQHCGQQGTDGLHPTRSARMRHPGPGQDGHRTADHRSQPGHRVQPGAEPDATGQPVGIRARRPAGEHAPRDEGGGQRGHQPDGGPGHHDGGPEDGPDDDHDAHAGHQSGGDRTDRAPQQRTAVGARLAHVGGTGVSSTIRVTSAGPSPPPPSAMSRWERHATATAWMSSGLT